MKTLTQADFAGPVEKIVANPPYWKSASGRINPDSQRAVARHEIKITLRDVVETAHRILSVSGKFIAIYPVDRAADIITQMRSLQIEPKMLRPVYSRENTDARLVIVEGAKGGRYGMTIRSPLIIYRADGSYTHEVEKLFHP